jgi:hypothetical protein
MTRIAITGHRGLPGNTACKIRDAIRRELAGENSGGGLIGLSCLADGADQIFARAVLDAGGCLEAIVPAAAYRDGLPEEARAEYDSLIVAATGITRLDFSESTSEAHMAASQVMLADADRLYAVWDGKPARGYGGTADVVADAKQRGIPVTVIWPPGATRDQGISPK